MGANDLHVVFGTGPLGLSIMRALCEKGIKIRMVNRSGKAELPPNVELVQADVTDPSQGRKVAQGAAVVYFAAQPGYTEWTTKFFPIMNGVIDAAASAGAKLIAGDNLYMYGDVDVLITEDLPYAATTKKGRVRAQMAQTFMEAHGKGNVRVAIGRASDFFGPAVLASLVGERVFYPVLEGKTVSLVGDPDAPHTVTYIDDFGRGLVTLGLHDEALGQTWHIPSAETLTLRQFVTLAFEEAGQTPQISKMPDLMVRIGSLFMPPVREVIEMMYAFKKPYIVDHSKFAQAFGADVTQHREAIRATLAWYRAHPITKH